MRPRRPDPTVLHRARAIQHLGRQVQALRQVWPALSAEVRGTTLFVAGQVQPTELSDTYLVRIVYAFEEPPKAYVDDPALKPRDGSPIPHVYEGPRPCLYLPSSGEWTGRELIAETIVPWLLLWLFYYEMWHATGEWLGGGTHPGDGAGEEDKPGEVAAACDQTPHHPSAPSV